MTGRIKHAGPVYSPATLPVKSGAGNLDGDPLFVDADHQNFRLQALSPAIDAALYSSEEEAVLQEYYTRYGVDIRKDIERRLRPQGRGWDIGAYEYTLGAIGDLAASGASQNSVTVGWMVPGADGSSDRPGRYDIRYAQAPLTEANWEAATQVQGEPAPGDVGEAQSFTLTGLDSGTTYYVGIKTSNTSGSTTSDLSNVVSATTSTSGNHAPLLTPIGDKTVAENAALTFTISAADADGDTLAYSAADLPTGAAFSAATRTFSWTPTNTQKGTYRVMFQVTDGQVTISETITITVLSGENRPPVLASIGSKNVAAGQTLSFTISATDPDGDSLTYSASNLPSGAAFDSATRTFTWTPASGQVGSHSVTFTVSDGRAQDSETITITVAHVNRPPVLASIGPRTVIENASLTFSVSGADPDGDALTYAAAGLPSGATFAGQTFTWTPAYDQAGSYSVTFTVSDGGLTDSETVAITVVEGTDRTPPSASGLFPVADAIQAPRNTLISLLVSDAGHGVDADTVTVRVNERLVYTGDHETYESDYGVCSRRGGPAAYRYSFQPTDEFDFDEPVTVRVTASDLAGNAMDPHAYSFRTEMRSFGENRPASWAPTDVDKGSPATVCDSTGTIWVVYHAGSVGQRDIYLSKLAPDSSVFASPLQLTDHAADQSYPDMAVGPDDTLYVVWQDNRRGHWDLYAMTSADGLTWSVPRLVVDSNDNQTAPAIAVDTRSPQRAYVAWQDDRAGDADIYVAYSSDAFAATTVARVTSNSAAQIGPALAVDGDNTVYVVWTDRRNGSDDVYGAASNVGPWTNVPIAAGAGNQSLAAIAAETAGSLLHLAWVDDLLGHQEIRYASSNGLPADPLTGAFIGDDTSDADQTTPSIVVTDSAGTDPKVFVCWQDTRNVTSSGQDTDLYFVEVRTADETNVLVGDGGTRSNQSEPALGVDAAGRPYAVWTDDRNSVDKIYYAGSNVADTPLVSQPLVAHLGGTVSAASPAGDISAVFPPGASPHDVTVTIAQIPNPCWPLSSSYVLAYEFGPSGLQFNQPMTVTIPYLFADYPDGAPVPCWYDALTGMFSQEGISDIEVLTLSPTVGAVRFTTTHFTPYLLVDALSDDDSEGGADFTGGGGCALSGGRGGRAIEFILPYAALAAVMVLLKRRDRAARRT